MGRKLAILGLTLAVLAAQPARAQQPGPFDVLADDLMGQMNGMVGRLRVMLGKDGQKTIAVLPFRADEVPVPVTVADGWTEELTDALVRRGGGSMRFVTRTDIGALIREAERTGEARNPVAAILRSTKADIIVRGKAFPAENGVDVSYTAVDRDGGIIATSRRHRLTVDGTGGGGRALTLDAAIAEAGKALASSANNLQSLANRGVRHAESRAESPFGRYLGEHVADSVRQAGSNMISGKVVRTVEAIPAAFGQRGVKVTGKTETPAATTRGLYLLEGSYWPLGKQVELRLSLRDDDGEQHAWTGRVLASSIDSALSLSPAGGDDGVFGGRDHLGPVRFDLDTAKGQDPVYRIGEKMVLRLRLDRDAFVHCYYRQADGNTLRIFPNTYHRSARIQAGNALELPSAAMPFDFTLTPPAGIERIKCLALDRDALAELPPELGKKDLEPIPPALANTLSDIYRRLPNLKVTEASLIVTVRQ